MLNLRAIPFARILIPYTAGIVTCLYMDIPADLHIYFIATASIFLFCFILQLFKKSKASLKWLYILAANLLLFTLAFESFYLYNQTHRADHYSRYMAAGNAQACTLSVTIDAIPVRHDNRMKLPVSIQGIYINNTWHKASGKTLLYLSDDSTAFELNDQLVIQGKPSRVQETGNPYEFDYAAFLEAHNIFHVFYLKPGSYYRSGKNTAWSLSNMGTQLNYKTVETLRESGLSPDAFAVCAALLVGYDDEIDSGVMRVFSHSGTLHVLSVSGLHTGVLYAFILGLFGLFDKHNRRKILKCVTVILCLFMLVCITGFAPAVFRAAIMVSLVLIGKTFFRNGNSFNTLLLSAFILLLADPYLIRDLGFLLSYLAVFGIMYLFPILQAFYQPTNKIMKWLWESSLLSVSATLFTLPISLYYFHQFPTWFLISNLLIIPLSIAIMLLAILLLIIAKVAVLKAALVFVINKLMALMIWLAGITDMPGFGYIDNIPFGTTDLICCSLLIVMLIASCLKKRFLYAIITGCIAIAWLGKSIFSVLSHNKDSELIVFKTHRKLSILVKNQSRLYYLGDSLTVAEAERSVKPYRQHDLSARYYDASGCNYIRVKQLSVCSINRNVSMASLDLMAPSVLLINTNELTPNKALTLRHTHYVVIANDVKHKTTEAWRKFCTKAGIRFHSIREAGAFRLPFES